MYDPKATTGLKDVLANAGLKISLNGESEEKNLQNVVIFTNKERKVSAVWISFSRRVVILDAR